MKKFKDWLINLLKGQAVKLALKRILGASVIGGPKAWVITFIVTELFDEIADPLIKLALTNLGYQYDKAEGKVMIRKIEKAKKEENENAYDDAVDSVFN